MNEINAIHLLLLAQGAQWVLLLRHLLQCRDIRRDIDRIKVHTGMVKP